MVPCECNTKGGGGGGNAIRFTEIVHDRSCKSVKQITENGLERSFVKYLLNSV